MEELHWTVPFYKTRDQILNACRPEDERLLTDEAKRQLLDVIFLLSEREIRNAKKYFPIFLQSLNQLYAHHHKTKAKKLIEKHVTELSQASWYNRELNLKNVGVIHKRISASKNAIELLKLEKESLHELSALDLSKLEESRMELESSLIRIERVLAYLKKKGTKSNLIVSDYALRLRQELSTNDDETFNFKIKNIDNCFNYTSEKKEQMTRANPMKIVVLALNSISITTNLNQLERQLKSFTTDKNLLLMGQYNIRLFVTHGLPKDPPLIYDVMWVCLLLKSRD